MTFESEVAEAGMFEHIEINADSRRHDDEVRDCLKRYYPDGDKAAEYLKLVEKHRGKTAAGRLRDDVRAAWKKRRIDETGQA